MLNTALFPLTESMDFHIVASSLKQIDNII